MRISFRSRRRGFFSVLILLAFLSAFTFLMLATAVITDTYKERMISRDRTRLENAVNGASKELADWLAAHLSAHAGDHTFTLYAPPLDDPVIPVPPWFFDERKKKYSEYDFSAEAVELYYSDAFEKTAEKKKLPLIEPFTDDRGRITRAYYLTVKAVMKNNPKVNYFCTVSIRAFRGKDGLIKIYQTAAYDQ